MLIGHGGQPLMELEKKTGAEVQFPGSRSYNQVAPAENAAELEDADPKDIVKVVGARAACEKAIAELLVSLFPTKWCIVFTVRRNLLPKRPLARRGRTTVNAMDPHHPRRSKFHSSTIISCALPEICSETLGVLVSISHKTASLPMKTVFPLVASTTRWKLTLMVSNGNRLNMALVPKMELQSLPSGHEMLRVLNRGRRSLQTLWPKQSVSLISDT